MGQGTDDLGDHEAGTGDGIGLDLRTGIGPDPDFVAAFLAVAADHPRHPALRHGDVTVDYGTAAGIVERCAATLRALVRPGDRIAFSIPKNPAAVLLMLAALRAGIPYVPLDATAPLPRRRQVLADAGPRLLITAAQTVEDWPGLGFEPFHEALPDLLVARPVPEKPATAPEPVPDSPDPLPGLAYILYTSGSTGAPKGVMISVTNARYFVAWAARSFPLGPGDRVAQHAPLHLDFAVYDLFVALASGACVHLIDERLALFPAAVFRLFRQERITAAYLTPSALVALAQRSDLGRDGLPALRQLLYAGEEFHLPHLRALMKTLPGARVANLYGPVETNVVTWQPVDPPGPAGTRVPIGRAVPGTDIRVLTEDGDLRDRSADGELLVSGPSVSPGYLNDPRLTRETRLRARVDGVERVYYRTGDFARLDDSGLAHFLGRRDGMVKTRGFRVETGDVEAALAAHPLVRQVAVVGVPDPEAGTVLAAHLVCAAGTEPTPAELRKWVGERLPQYMVPARVDFHDRLPTTGTGKIARRELVLAHEMAEPAGPEEAAGA